jgi:hypothetical protein
LKNEVKKNKKPTMKGEIKKKKKGRNQVLMGQAHVFGLN